MRKRADLKMLGALLAFFAAVLIGLSAISAKKGLEHVDVFMGTSISVFVGCAIFLSFSVFTSPHTLQAVGPRAMGFFAAAGLIHFFIGTTFKHASIKKIGASRGEPIISITPLIAVLLAVITLGESISLPILTGTGLVVIGVYFIATS